MDYLSRYTFRTTKLLLDKLEFVAKYEGRSKNKELEQLVKKRIAAFEKEHGPIPIDKDAF